MSNLLTRPLKTSADIPRFLNDLEIPPMWFSKIEPCEKGVNKILNFEVSENESFMSFIGRDYVPAGKYTGLRINGATMMSDTPKEYADHLDLVRAACGRILIMGLGLGCIAHVLANIEVVDSITIVERDQDIIDMVAPSLEQYGEKVTIIQGDAFTVKPDLNGLANMYDIIWHDIWIDRSEDNQDEMVTLMKQWAGHCEFQDCWSLNELYDRRYESMLSEEEEETYDYIDVMFSRIPRTWRLVDPDAEDEEDDY